MPVWLGLLIGIALVVLTWTIIGFTVVVPRALRGPGRLSVWVNRATRWILVRVSRLARTYEAKDAVLASIGAVALLAQLLAWLFLWEQWAAELCESHTTYPVLLLFRSPDPWWSWRRGSPRLTGAWREAR
jgi:hypothetical protein